MIKKEEAVDGYGTSISGSQSSGYVVTNTKGGPTDDGAVVTTSGRETGQPGTGTTGTGNSAGTDQSVGNSAANSGVTAQPRRQR